jgi:hypothetical protein
VNEHDTGYLAEEITFGHIYFLVTEITEIIRDNFTLVGTFEGKQKIRFILYFDAEGKEWFDILFFLFAGVTDHLYGIETLEYLIKEVSVFGRFEDGLELVEKKIEKFCGILLDEGVDRWRECLKQSFWYIIYFL